MSLLGQAKRPKVDYDRLRARGSPFDRLRDRDGMVGSGTVGRCIDRLSGFPFDKLRDRSGALGAGTVDSGRSFDGRAP